MENSAADIERNIQEANREIDDLIAAFGESYAVLKGLNAISGREGALHYLMQKHHWLPKDLFAMTREELELALHQELQHGLPKEF